jgi:hypothetical protein
MSDSSSGGLVQRMRLARRVADALLPQEGDVVLAAATAPDVLTGSVYEGSLHTDFLLTALDLQMRVSLLVGRDQTALQDPETLREADLLLWSNPESFACLLVADDESLTSRIVEASDMGQRRPRSAVVRRSLTTGPLQEIVAAYLRTISLEWSEPTSLPSNDDVSFDEEARKASLDSLNTRRRARSPIPERRKARESLSENDARWASSIALAAINEGRIDVEKEIFSRKDIIGDVR